MIDLHMHSNFSLDAHDSPEEMIEQAKARGARVVSLTDHHTREGTERARAAAQSLGLEYVSGIETTGVVQVNGRELSVDVLGYYLEGECPNTDRIGEQILTREAYNIEKTLVGLNARKIPIERSMIEEPVIHMKIRRWLVENGWADDELVAKAMMEEARVEATSESADAPPDKPSLSEVIEALKSDGATTLMAHPFWYLRAKRGGLSVEEIWPILDRAVELGVDGIEIVNKGNDCGMANNVFGYCLEHGLTGTGGTDAHRAEGVASVFVPWAFYESLCNVRNGRPPWKDNVRAFP